MATTQEPDAVGQFIEPSLDRPALEIDFESTFCLGAHNSFVLELHRRLHRLGYLVPQDSNLFTEKTAAAVELFQISRGLEADGICSDQTWRAIIEASFVLGDRLLYQTSPMMRGEDIAELQLKLGTLGFDAGRVDGIFGPNTRRAVGEFQRNVDIVTDDVCGPEVVDHLQRLASRGTHVSVAGLRERESLRDRPRVASELRVALVHTGEDLGILGRIGFELQHLGTSVAVFSSPTWSDAAQLVNLFQADVCVGLGTRVQPGAEIQYFGTAGFESIAGRHLSEVILAELPLALTSQASHSIPMRSPLLRETRCPAVLVQIGPSDSLSDTTSQIESAIHRSLDRWTDGLPELARTAPRQPSPSASS